MTSTTLAIKQLVKEKRTKEVCETLCFVCDRKIGYKDYRYLPKGKLNEKAELMHIGCEIGSKNWKLKFPNSPLSPYWERHYKRKEEEAVRFKAKMAELTRTTKTIKSLENEAELREENVMRKTKRDVEKTAKATKAPAEAAAPVAKTPKVSKNFIGRIKYNQFMGEHEKSPIQWSLVEELDGHHVRIAGAHGKEFVITVDAKKPVVVPAMAAIEEIVQVITQELITS